MCTPSQYIVARPATLRLYDHSCGCCGSVILLRSSCDVSTMGGRKIGNAQAGCITYFKTDVDGLY